MKALRAERVQDIDALEELGNEWWDLWRRIPGSTPFQSPGWLTPWWRAFHPGLLEVVTVRRNGTLVAVAPLYLEQSAQRQRLLPIGISLSDQLDVLIDPACEEEAGAKLVGFLAERAAPDTVISLEELAPGAAALRLEFDGGWISERMPQNAQPVLSLPSCLGELQHRIPPRKLRDLRAARRRLGEDAKIVASGPAQLDWALRELFRLHGLLWASRGEPGVLSDPAVRDFHMQAIPQLMRAGLVRLYALRVSERVIAVYYGFLHRGCAYAYLAGFDPAFGSASPGTILIGHAIEQAVIEGARELNFLRGREKYKYRWGAVDRWNVRMELRRR